MNPYRIQHGRLRDLLARLIDIYSPSGKEGEIADFLEAYFSQHGLHVVRQPVDEDRDNILLFDDTAAPQVVFVGHIDTVPAFDFDSYKSREDDGRIIGLGSTDMKGGCAAMIEAFLSFRDRGNARFPAALALVVGEEESGDGILKLLEEYHCPWAIVGEPTDLVPCLNHFGYIEIQLNTAGRRVHASIADPAANAIRSMLDIILQLCSHLDQQRKEIIYNIRDLNSSPAGFAAPDWCVSRIDLHIPPLFPTGELAWELEEIVKKDTITFVSIHEGYDLPDKGLLPDLLRTIYQRRGIEWHTGSFRSDSDATHLWRAGIKPILLGPGSLSHAHTEDESIDFAAVEQCAMLYLDILEALAVQSAL